MYDHASLVADQLLIERMASGERLKIAKKKRQQQLKKYQQYEKQLEKEDGGMGGVGGRKGSKGLVVSGGDRGGGGSKNRKSGKGPVRFVNNVVLLESSGRGDINEVRQLLESGVSSNASNDDGLTALHQCCIDDSEAMLKLLIEYGADVNARDSELWTPLHAAATCGHVHLCRYLIESGADLLAVNADGNMPYDICEDETVLDFIETEMAKQGVTQELIDTTRLSHEAAMLADLKMLSLSTDDINGSYRGRNGETPLHISAANGYTKVTEFLLQQQNVRVDVLDNDSWQPIHCAACWGQLQVVHMLVEHGASFYAKTKNGETPIDVCEDVELKQRIIEMKEELEKNSRLNKPRGQEPLSRKRSVNPRSSSVRRTSMRDKNAMSWKEAREEALRMREPAPSSQAEEDEEGGGGGGIGGAGEERQEDRLAISVSSNNNNRLSPNSAPDRNKCQEQSSSSSLSSSKKGVTENGAPRSQLLPSQTNNLLKPHSSETTTAATTDPTIFDSEAQDGDGDKLSPVSQDCDQKIVSTDLNHAGAERHISDGGAGGFISRGGGVKLGEGGMGGGGKKNRNQKQRGSLHSSAAVPIIDENDDVKRRQRRCCNIL